MGLVLPQVHGGAFGWVSVAAGALGAALLVHLRGVEGGRRRAVRDLKNIERQLGLAATVQERAFAYTLPLVLTTVLVDSYLLASGVAMLTDSCLSPLNWFACARCREDLHTWADLAVIVAVVVGVTALIWQWLERRERRAAVDALLRALASRGMYVWQTMLGNRPLGDPEGVNYLAQYVTGIGHAMGESLAATFTGIAAQVPYASRSLCGPAREVGALYWSIVARTEEYRVRRTPIGADLQAALERDHGAVQTLLTQIAGPEVTSR